MNEFRKSHQVSKSELNRSKEIIRKLDELEQIYNPERQNLDRRTNILRSGDNIYLNVMLITGLLFSINDSSKGTVDSTITGRIKSIESTRLKTNRAGRENKKNRDIVACCVSIDRVHNSKNFFNIFRSDKIQGLYNERKSNLVLMKIAIDFLREFDMYGISSELDDKLSHEESRRRLQQMKNDCQIILDNINTYYKEEGTNLSEEEFPIREWLQVMCEDLMQQEAERAVKTLDKEIERMEKEQGDAESTFEENLSKVNLNNLKMRKNMLDTKTSHTQKELITILNGVIDEERMELYKSVLQYLKEREIEESYDDNTNKVESSKEKTYCEILMLILYQLTKLEFVKESQYKGLIYQNIWRNLQNQIELYKYCEVDHGTYGNITFENLQKLLTNLIRLNARLSDPLQYEISKYQMRYSLKSIIQAYKGTDLMVCEEKIKPNGYVADHYDFDDFEIKAMTHFRERVATIGSASYTNGRIDNKDEKKKEISNLNYGRYMLKIPERPPIIKFAELTTRLGKKLSLDDSLKKYIQENQNTAEVKAGIEKWRKKVLGIIPRYFSARYNEEKNVVEIEFLSEVKNVNKLYSETSILQVREEVKRKTKQLKKLGFLLDEPLKIEVSRTQYRDFLQYELKNLKNKIDTKLNPKEQDDQKTKGMAPEA